MFSTLFLITLAKDKLEKMPKGSIHFLCILAYKGGLMHDIHKVSRILNFPPKDWIVYY